MKKLFNCKLSVDKMRIITKWFIIIFLICDYVLRENNNANTFRFMGVFVGIILLAIITLNYKSNQKEEEITTIEKLYWHYMIEVKTQNKHIKFNGIRSSNRITEGVYLPLFEILKKTADDNDTSIGSVLVTYSQQISENDFKNMDVCYNESRSK